MCGSQDDCDSFSDLLSDSDDDFNLSAGVLASLPNSLRTRSTLQNAFEFQLGPATHDGINDYMLNTDDDNTGCCSQIESKWTVDQQSPSRVRGRPTLQPRRPWSKTQLCAWVMKKLHTSAQRIEAMVVDFLEQLSAALPSTEEDVKNVLRGKRKNPRKLELRLTDRKKLSNDGAFGTRTQTFPKGVRGSIIPFAQFFRIADLAHEAIMNGLPATKRDVQLFKKQSVVDKLVDDLAATIDTTRAQLNIRASPKGLICGGGLSIRTISGEVIQVTESEGTLIPVAEDIASLDFSKNINWVLVIEKEGKGYPDLATRQIVKTLSDILPSTVPFVTLVDGDAYGLDIASVYKFGSVTLRHESHRLAVPRIEDLLTRTRFGVDRCALLPISRADEKKARSMLRRELPDHWKKELVHMLYTRRKAETEILSSVSCIPGEPHPLAKYLADKIREHILALAWQHTSGVSTTDDVDEAFFDELLL
ncbi:Spo11/DNA topoisomerase VI subunit A [Lactarius quietus]|nr:Spo11/DNA topoisomerase VI subunit A [Lactarius quietus]